MVEIVPAIMPASLKEAREKIALVALHTAVVQLDLMDGMFVPEKTWPYTTESGTPDAEFSLSDLYASADRVVGYEIDLMVRNPFDAARFWIAQGAERIILHFEGIEEQDSLPHDLKALREQADSLGHSVALGLAIAIATPETLLVPYLADIDFVQCMGIAAIGYQGTPFDARVIPKVAYLRKTAPELIISIDGGVNFESAPHLIAAGANRLVSGSAIFASSDVEQTIRDLGGS